MPRLFFAIETPQAIKKLLVPLQDDIAKRLRSLPAPPNFKPEKLINSHCTLRFLGNVEESRIPHISSAVSRALIEAAIAHFSFALGKCGSFERRNRASVIWIGLVPELPFQRLQHAIDAGLAKTNIPFDSDHSFHPHLTLFRFREPYIIPATFEFPTFTANTISSVASEILLIESRTLPEGPVHTILDRFALA